MSDSSEDAQALKSNPKTAFSEHLEAFKESFNSLYITRNASGRNKFREKWPDVALLIFGEALIAFDDHGDIDFEERAKLEEEANLRRIEFEKIVHEFEQNSVDSGVLNSEYIGQIIDKVGVKIAVLLYADVIIDRIRPGLLVKNDVQADEVAADDQKLSQDEIEILKNKPETHEKTLPPKGTLKTLFNWLGAQGAQNMQAA